MKNLLLQWVGKVYSWLGNKEGTCKYEFPCKDHHEHCQKTVDDLRKELKC